jgi:hydrogenase nickel incorporation protein HypA/HybF
VEPEPATTAPSGNGVCAARHCQFTLAPPRHFIYPAVLLLLAEQPRHGYRLVDPLLGMGFGPTMDRPSVYRALADLHRDGLLETWSAASTAGSARHMYAVTEAGFAALRAWIGIIAEEDERLRHVVARFRRLEDPSGGDGAGGNGSAGNGSSKSAPGAAAQGVAGAAGGRGRHVAGVPVAPGDPPGSGGAADGGAFALPDLLGTGSTLVASAAPPLRSALGVPMHELSIAASIADAVGRHAGGAPVQRVRIDVGHLRQVVPDSLAFCWEMVTDGTDLAGAALEITEIPASVECRACQRTATLADPIMLCPGCGSADLAVTAGEELQIRSYDLAGA